MEKHILNIPSGSSQITTDNSRKVYLHTLYTNLLLRHSLLLFFNIASVNFHILINLRTALAPMGIHLKVLRRRVFINSLRVARYVETSRTRPGECGIQRASQCVLKFSIENVVPRNLK